VLRLFQRICEAVGFAHARGVVHRDLKPENVMVGEFGEALVMDWGIAKELGATSSAAPVPAAADAVADTLPLLGGTAAGTVIGTPAYMPPEQARGEPVDARSDVYGLGAILYALLARRPPHATLAAAMESAPPPLRAIDPEIARPLESICSRAMAKDPAARYPSALELAADVGAYLDAEPVKAHRENPLEIAMRFASKHRVLLSLLGVYLLVRVLLVVLSR
jgi:eukaryotic-like serine/threonine-protein kinase